MIELKNVSKYYSNNGVVTLGLRNINLKFEIGEIVAITGDSGSGKSTLLNVITAVDTYEEGEIYFQGNETSYFNQDDMDDFRKENVSFIFQNYNIIESYTVLENVILPLILRGKRYEEAKKEAIEIIEKVGLSKRIHNRGSKLSGGEKQRCVIARALASDSKILACDEPTGNLDSQTGDEIMKLIQEVSKDKLVLIVTHNYDQVKDIVTRKIKISDGEVIEDVYVKEVDSSNVNELFISERPKMKKTFFLKLALQNIFSTPKKTIFSLIVFMVISFAALLLFLLMMFQSHETYTDYNVAYDLRTNDRLIVYNMDHSPLDKELLLKTKYNEIYYNAFYEETPIQIYNKKEQFCEIKLTYKKLKYSLIQGREVLNSGEYFIVIPKDYDYDLDMLLNTINQDIYSKDGIFAKELTAVGKLVGVGYCKDITHSYMMCYDTFDKRLFSSPEINATYEVDGQTKPLYSTYDTETYIICPKEYEGKISFQFTLSKLYPLRASIEIRYDEEATDVLLYTPFYYGLFADMSFDEIYEAVIYTNQIKSTKKYLEECGYHVSVPAEQSVKANTFSLVLLYFYFGISIIALICLFFISYVILARVYASKNKDYAVLRTLGMVKKQLGRIVVLETLVIGLVAAILSLIIFIICYHTTKNFSMGKYLNLGIGILYFVAILLFSYFIARRFNRRLFKFSVNTTLKGEAARND